MSRLSAFPRFAVGGSNEPWYRKRSLAGQRRAPSSFRAEALAHADALFRLACRLTGSEADAEDLVQDTYARAFGKAESFTEGTNLRAWLFRILRNAHVDAYRRARAERIDASADTEVDLASQQELLRDDQELERLRSVVAGDIQAALLTLSPDARAVVLLDLEGLNEAELATVLGCPVGTVKSRLMRARQALRKRLRDYAR